MCIRDSPNGNGFGEAVILHDGGSSTVRVAVSLAVPPSPLTVIVHVVVDVGDTVVLEDIGGFDVPILGDITAVPASPDVFHCNVADCPEEMVVGDTERLTVGGV